MQRDTIVCYDTVKILRQEIVTKPVVRTEVEYVYIGKVDTVYRDSIRYISLPREYYHTKAKNVEIWHSGIDSTIDSLNVVRESVKITDKYIPKNVKNHISLGMEANCYQSVSIPIYFEYERLLQKNVGIYGKVGYDLSSGLWGIGVGARLQLQW